jgi:hypothetical protein
MHALFQKDGHSETKIKVEKIQEDSMNSIPSPSPPVKNSNYWRESLLDVICYNIAG